MDEIVLVVLISTVDDIWVKGVGPLKRVRQLVLISSFDHLLDTYHYSEIACSFPLHFPHSVIVLLLVMFVVTSWVLTFEMFARWRHCATCADY